MYFIFRTQVSKLYKTKRAKMLAPTDYLWNRYMCAQLQRACIYIFLKENWRKL